MNVSDALSPDEAPSSFHSHFAAKSFVRPKKVVSTPGLVDNVTGGEPSPSAPPPPAPLSSLPPPLPAGDGREEDSSLTSSMAATAWKPVLSGLSVCLGACEQEGILAYILKSFQTFAATCGRLSLDRARDALLVSLCQFSLPNWRPTAGVGTAVLASVMESGWKPSSSKTLLTQKHILVGSRCIVIH